MRYVAPDYGAASVTMSNEMDFGDMTRTGGDESDDSYDLQNDFQTVEMEDAGDTVVGELIDVLEDIGQYDSRAYLLESDGEKVMVWGNASINAAYDSAEDDIDAGDMLGIQRTDRTYENEYGEFAQYEVRYQKA